MRRSFVAAALGTTTLGFLAASPLEAHGGHENALGASPLIHAAVHLAGTPEAWAVVLLGAWALIVVRSPFRAGP